MLQSLFLKPGTPREHPEKTLNTTDADETSETTKIPGLIQLSKRGIMRAVQQRLNKSYNLYSQIQKHQENTLEKP